jgi:hypothetical protein
MAVDPLELRPRGAVALFDAAIRVCGRTSGVWALTLPAGAALVAAVFEVAEVARSGGTLATPVALLTAAWALRAVAQGAACHHVERQLLGSGEPTVRESLVAALRRAPSLVTTSAVVAVLNGVLWLFTAGLGFFFLGAHAAAYATTMHGQGSALRVYGTASKLLGPARHTAAWVRLCGLTQVLVALNLTLATSLAVYLGRSVLGLDLSYVDRFTSLDNPVWLATVLATTFALFEPLRAAAGALLLIDGRVRQEGLDLLAAVEQLPRRRVLKSVPLTAALLLAVAVWPSAASAKSALRERADRLIAHCEMGDLDTTSLDVGQGLSKGDPAALSRFVSRVERRGYDEEDCEGAESELRTGLHLFSESLNAPPPDALGSRDAAKAILARPEFQVAPERPKDDPAQAEESESWLAKWWRNFWRAVWEWLHRREPREAPDRPTSTGDASMGGANAVMLFAIAAVAGALIFILWSGWKRKATEGDAIPDESGKVSESALSDDPMSALSRAPQGWAELADRLAAEGEFREAIRHLYLALLSRLHRDGAIDYDPTCSNWEYLATFKGAREHKPPFRELTRRFDFVWYGNLDATLASYQTFRQTAGPLLAPRSDGAPTRA